MDNNIVPISQKRDLAGALDQAMTHIANAIAVVDLIEEKAIADGGPEDDTLEGAAHSIKNELTAARNHISIVNEGMANG
ncbi:MAG: hypothetical protein WD944_06525 [Steroidobacteraceae bacterium]